MVQKLRKAAVPQKEVQKLTGIRERTIREIEKEPEITDSDEGDFPEIEKPGTAKSGYGIRGRNSSMV